MTRPDSTVAAWLAESETSIALFCIATGCGHGAAFVLANLPPRQTRDRLARPARCAKRGSRGAQVMKDMAEHYRRMEEESSSDPAPRQGRTWQPARKRRAASA
ncbi:hypothetical protein [Methylorubrum aminovorans]